MSEYQKLLEMIGMYEKILHPDFFNPIMKQIYATYEECKVEAYKNASISDEALWLEKQIDHYKKSNDISMGNKQSRAFYLKCLYKEIIKKFNL